MKTIMLPALVIGAFHLPANAQNPAAAPAAQTGLGGTAIPGLCLLSRPAVVANAKVGVAATARLQSLAHQAQSELDALRTTLEAERKALQDQVGKLSASDRQAREQTLVGRARQLQVKSVQLNRQIEATREKAFARIATEMQPVVQQAYRARSCGMLVDRNTVLGGNMTNDLTAAVVQGLDARLTSISFDLEPPPTAATPAS